ncbi:MAG: glycosyltransferase family 1 protein [Bacteroidota bacterium]
MRIAVNTRFLLKDRLEGIGRVSYELSRRLVEQHPEDEFLFLFDRAYDPSFLFSDRVTARVVSPPARHPILWYAWFEWGIPKALRQWKADVFFSPDNYCSLRSNCPSLMLCHDLAHLHHPDQIPSLVRRYYDHFVPRFLQRADHIGAVSAYTQADVQQQYGIEAQKISVLYNGCRDIFQALSPQQQESVRQEFSQGQPYWFYAGAVHPRKNVDGLIRAFNRFKEQTNAPHKLLIGGRWAWQTGPVKTAYEESAHRQDIEFLGFLSEQDLGQLLGAAYGLVYVSHFEGFGLPVLEAMHSEVPVITSNSSSLPEVAGNAALLVDPKEDAQIAKAMVRLWEEKGLREELIERGRKQRGQFDWDQSAAKLYSLLERLTKDGTVNK